MGFILWVTFQINTIDNSLPKGLLESLCYVESTWRVNAIHKDDGNSNSVGICQVKLSTARYLGFKGTEKDLMLPENNIKYAAKYLSKNITRYTDITKGIVAYNRGNAKGLTSTKYSTKVIKQWGINANLCRSAASP